MNAPSIGKHFHKFIAYGYRYTQVGNYSYSRFSIPERKVEKPALPSDLRGLYRKLALRFHPDRANGSEELMKEINNYYKECNYYSLRQIALKYGVG